MKLGTLEFVIFSLAIWRLSSLFANEEGPFLIFGRLRLYCEKLSNNNLLCKAFHLYEGLCCEWCNSIWFAFPLSLIFERSIFNNFFVPLAASTCVILLKHVRELIEGVKNAYEKSNN